MATANPNEIRSSPEKLRPTNAVIGTKVRLPGSARGSISADVSSSLEASLQRLGLEAVDILYLHNAITVTEGAESLSTRQVLEEVVPAFENSGNRARSGFWFYSHRGHRSPSESYRCARL
jgi:L-galactose dehydrogenase/L-glyceraldehyde 3-phosphate reductase